MPKATQTKSEPSTNIPLTLSRGSISAGIGLNVLQDTSGCIYQTSKADSPYLILGLRASGSKPVNTADVTVGKLNCTNWLACARIKLFWMAPAWGSAASELPPETQFLLVQLAAGGPYAVLLPLIDSGTFRATLRPPRCDNFCSIDCPRNGYGTFWGASTRSS